MVCSTIRDILVQAESKFGAEDAIRYKGHKKEIITKSYTQLKKDSAAFSSALRERGMDGRHIALTGPTSYEWIVSFFGIVNSGSIAVPLDVSLPVDEMCDLINRSDAEVFVMDEVRADVGALVRERCPRKICDFDAEGRGRRTVGFVLAAARTAKRRLGSGRRTGSALHDHVYVGNDGKE